MGLPNHEGVATVLALLDKEAQLLAEIERLREAVEPLRQMEARLKAAGEELLQQTREIGRLLDTMDVSSFGNFGFDGRMGWFLREMRRVIVAKAKGGA